MSDGKGIKKPDKVYPRSERSTPYASHMPETIQDPSLHGGAFDQLLNNRGIRFVHRKSMPCPNLKSLSDNSHDPDCEYCDNSGIMYFKEEEIFGAWASNTLQKLFEVQGVWEVGTAIVSFPTEYKSGEQADFKTFDQLVIPDFEVRLDDIIEYEPTPNRRQRIRYPINRIECMSSIVNGQIKIYEAGVDYNLVDGDIEWVQGREPTYNPASETGEVISLNYATNPVYTVLNVMHELRATQEMGSDGVKKARRLQQQVLVKRDFLVQEDSRDRTVSDN